jgi:hypothetical protein
MFVVRGIGWYSHRALESTVMFCAVRLYAFLFLLLYEICSYLTVGVRLGFRLALCLSSELDDVGI